MEYVHDEQKVAIAHFVKPAANSQSPQVSDGYERSHKAR